MRMKKIFIYREYIERPRLHREIKIGESEKIDTLFLQSPL